MLIRVTISEGLETIKCVISFDIRVSKCSVLHKLKPLACLYQQLREIEGIVRLWVNLST